MEIKKIEDLSDLPISEIYEIKWRVEGILSSFSTSVCFLIGRIAKIIINTKEPIFHVFNDDSVYGLTVDQSNAEYIKLVEPVFKNLFQNSRIRTINVPYTKGSFLKPAKFKEVPLTIEFNISLLHSEKLLKSLIAMNDKELAVWLKLECGG